MTGAPGSDAGPGAGTPLAPGRPRPTRRVALHLLLGLLLYAAGANVGAGWVVLLAALLLATVPAGWWRLRRRLRTVTAVRTTPELATAGRPTTTTLGVRASGRGLVTVHDHLGDVVATTTTDGTRSVHARPVLRRGAHDTARVSVELRDAFGLWVGRADGPVPLPRELVVRPRPADAGALDRLVGGPRQAEQHHTSRPRRGVDVDGVREYRPGDPVRAVHWRASARGDDLLVRQLRGPDLPDVTVVLGAGPWQRAVLDHTCELVLGLLADASDRGHEVELHADGEHARGVSAAAALLATLPPHDGEATRPLLASPVPDDALELEPGVDGPVVRKRSPA